MASLTSTSFPAGVSVGAYPASNWLQSQLPPSGSPQGSATETHTVGSDGSVAFSALADSTRYYLAGQVSGTYRYVQVQTPPPSSVGAGSVQVRDEGSNLTQRANLNFTGAGVTAADNAVTGATDVTIPGGGGSAAPRIVGAVGTNLGATQTVTFSGAEEVWLLGTLNANLTVTLASRTAGARLVFLGVQDATGGRTLTVSDGTNTQAVPIQSSASALAPARFFCPDATDIDVEQIGGGGFANPMTTAGDLILGGASGAASRLAKGSNAQVLSVDGSGNVVWAPADVTQAELDAVSAAAVQASLVDAKGDLIVGSADNTVVRKAVGSDGQVLTADAASAGGVKWAAAAGGGGTGLWACPLVAGRSYNPPGSPSGSNVGAATGTAFARAFPVGRTTTITTVRVQVTVAATGTPTGRIGVYSDNGGKPGTLIAEATSTVDPTTTGVKSVAISAPVTAGTIVWLVYVEQGATSAGSYRGFSSPSADPYEPADPTNLGTGAAGWQDTAEFTTGAMPTTPTTWSNSNTSIVIQVSAAA